jgi:FdhE protein
MMADVASLDGLKRARPEWRPWLAVLEDVARESQAAHWERAVPAPASPRHDGMPLLAGTAIELQARSVRGWLQRLLRLAAGGTTDAMRSLANARVTDGECLALFASSLRHDGAAVDRVARAHGVDGEALQAVVALLPVPFLQTANRRLSHGIRTTWTAGYCPVCGTWPAFAEIRGIERTRHFRCGRCGGEWYARALVCAFCDMSNHDELAALVPATTDTHAVIDACNACRGYVKAFTRLQGCAPGTVMIEDLASVALDMAAIEHGYARPPGAGYPIDVTVREAEGRRPLFGWRS